MKEHSSYLVHLTGLLDSKNYGRRQKGDRNGMQQSCYRAYLEPSSGRFSAHTQLSWVCWDIVSNISQVWELMGYNINYLRNGVMVRGGELRW